MLRRNRVLFPTVVGRESLTLRQLLAELGVAHQFDVSSGHVVVTTTPMPEDDALALLDVAHEQGHKGRLASAY
jgi:hypothetical protein